MNIVHLTTFNSGGAANAAIQLHTALLEAGEDSSILFVQSLNENTAIQNSYSLSKQDFSLRLKNKWNKIIKPNDKIEARFRALNDRVKVENITLPFSNYDVLKHPVIKKADIVHLHWVAGMINYPVFFKQVTQKLVWTLHDMNPFNGIFFYEEDEILNKENAAELNEKIIEIKEKAYKSISTQLWINTPCDWLKQKASKSKLLSEFPCINIPYIVDLDTFYPRHKIENRSNLGIPENAIVLLFAASAINNKRKGFDLLQEAFKYIQLNQTPVHIIAIGNPCSILDNNLHIRFSGEIHNKQILSEYYAAADALILPSREDNLPNVMLEAFASGIPVIAFPVGGIEENIYDGITGYLAEEISGEALAIVLQRFINDPYIFSPDIIRSISEEKFHKKTVVPQFQRLYRELINTN